MKNPFLSIVIPLYNEERSVKNLSKIYKFLNSLNFNYEVIIVNDGSIDNTLNKLINLSKKFTFKLISHKKNGGKGAAVQTGMLAAKGNYRLFTDIDLSTPIEEFIKFIPFLRKYDLIIGSRRMKESLVKHRQSIARESLGRGFTILSRLFLNTKISDFTCGFKCFSKETSEKIFSLQKIKRWGFDSEILFIARKLKLNIMEIPIIWINNPDTKVKFPRDIINSALDLCKIRYYSLIKKYEKNNVL